MASIFPFNGVMPTPQLTAIVATPPYDVMSRTEAVAMVKDNDKSFLHVTRSEIDLPEDVSPYDEAVYQKALENYSSLKNKGVLETDAQESFYVYRLIMNGRSQTGVVVAASVDDYDLDIIKKHEKTRQVKEDDRTRHILTTGAQTGPVFLTCRGTAFLAEVIGRTISQMPIRDFTAEDGISHSLWRVRSDDTQAMAKAFADIPVLYIADGHHRAASASRARAVRRERNPGHTGNEEYNRFLTVVFPASELEILAYNRAVTDLNGLKPEQLLAGMAEIATVTPASSPIPAIPGTCAMYLNGSWYKIAFKADLTELSVVDQLDVSILQNLVLAPMLGIADPRTSNRVDFIGGIRGTKELEKRVNAGEMAVAFSMYPTTVEQLMAISDAGEIMPPKSTWFEPKLRDAVVIHEI